MLAMLMYPEAQSKAHKELDDVLGAGILPDFQDEESLPYISAIIKEVLRWQSVTPIGDFSIMPPPIPPLTLGTAIPHQLMTDDTYNGYHIPAGSIIIPNAW